MTDIGIHNLIIELKTLVIYRNWLELSVGEMDVPGEGIQEFMLEYHLYMIGSIIMLN